MIASVRGEVLEIALDHVVLEAAGVGYKVMATPSTLATLRRGAEARLIIAMIVREDSMTLYGFVDGDALGPQLVEVGLHLVSAARHADRIGEQHPADLARETDPLRDPGQPGQEHGHHRAGLEVRGQTGNTGFGLGLDGDNSS
jgi:hypothetical protein